ncbi:MAG: hypothetical protein PHE52_01530 [Candidatus Pacebacteria bacterium]|nr:hypothetical protein [Candidatus Paceibacterota bacterium]
MPETRTKEQFEKLFDQLPPELQEAIFSMETSDNILNACKTYGIINEEVSQIADYVGQSLMGLLPPSQFQETIQEKVGLPKVLARAITQEINRFVFYPLKPLLEGLYKIELGKPVGTEETEEVKESPREESAASASKDIYREIVE